MYKLSGSNLSRIAIIAYDKCGKKCMSVPVAGGKVYVPSDRLNGYRLPAGETAKVNTDLKRLGQPRTLNGQVVLPATVGQ